MTDFDHPSIGPGALIGSGLTCLLDEPAYVLLRVGFGAILVTLGKVADVFRERLTPGDDIVGHVQDILKLAVPRDQMLCFVEHCDAVAHVFEGDAQFGLTLREFRGPFAQCAEVGDAANGDDGLFREGLQQRDLTVGEAAGTPRHGARLNQLPDRRASVGLSNATEYLS